VEQRHVAELHHRARAADQVQPFEGEAEDLRIRRGSVGPADGFDARLQELAALVGAHAEDRPAIGVAGRT
jgi:hypothetical protein